jgi:hypothetical protein
MENVDTLSKQDLIGRINSLCETLNWSRRYVGRYLDAHPLNNNDAKNCLHKMNEILNEEVEK